MENTSTTASNNNNTRGEGGRRKQRERNQELEVEMPQDYRILMATTATIIKINKKLDGRHRLHEGIQRFYHDMTCQGYEWLMIGWVGEERHMPHGRM
jgi:hypothetical protein